MMQAPNSASSTWAIETQGLSKSFGTKPALRGVDLTVGWGESVVIFGHNGAGKTTLIKVLATIMNPSSGSVLVDGLSLKDHDAQLRRRIGVVTHQTFLYNNLTGYENLAFYARLYDVPERKDRIHEVAGMLGMKSRLHDRVGTLSRGMQQRLSIARSLLHRPGIVLLDEPETGLDQQAISMAWQALRREGETERTVILTTHNLERGLEVSNRLMILAQGKIVYQHSTHALDIADLKETFEQSVRVRA